LWVSIKAILPTCAIALGISFHFNAARIKEKANDNSSSRQAMERYFRTETLKLETDSEPGSHPLRTKSKKAKILNFRW
jgi:hypothetical protein